MKFIIHGSGLAYGVLAVGICGARAQSSSVTTSTSCSQPTASYPTPSVTSGWDARLMINGFMRPRGIIFDTAGNLLVVDSGIGIVGIQGDECLQKLNVINSTEVSNLRYLLRFGHFIRSLFYGSCHKGYMI